MKRYYLIVLTVAVFVSATVIGIGTALAGESIAQLRGEEYHCYLFFTLPDGRFAQVPVNDPDPDKLIWKVEELIQKYEDDEGGTLAFSIGNIEYSLCGPPNCDVYDPAGTGGPGFYLTPPDKDTYGPIPTFCTTLLG